MDNIIKIEHRVNCPYCGNGMYLTSCGAGKLEDVYCYACPKCHARTPIADNLEEALEKALSIKKGD